MKSKPKQSCISLKGVRQNNLKNFDLTIPHHTLTVITGPSGSGKSSLAFDTLYAEGQRRYVETFSPYTRQFLERMDKPQVESIVGIPPAIAIEQSNPVRTTRSTVGTMTEITDYLKLLFPHLAHLYCPQCQREIKPSNAQTIAQNLLSNPAFKNQEILITFTLPFPEKTPAAEALTFVQAQGFRRLLWQSQILRLEEAHQQTNLLQENQLTLIQDRLKLDSALTQARLIEALESALSFGKGLISIYRFIDQKIEDNPLLYSNRWHCPYDNLDFRPPTPALFSFNNPLGACSTCHGFGRTIEIDYDLVLPDKTKTLAENAIKPFRTESSKECKSDLLRACKKHKIPTDIPFCELTDDQQKLILEGETSSLSRLELWQKNKWYGVRGYFDWLETKTYKMHVRVLLSRYRAYQTCSVCHGARFQPETLNWKITTSQAMLSLAQINALSIHEALSFFKQLPLLPNLDEATTLLFKEITTRLTFLEEVGLGYLTLDRTTRTLSGGEIQRVNLTTCLGSSLVNTLFILDEPSIGLHPRDTDRLTHILYHLRDLGNTVVVVEHEESIIRAADYLVDLGPGRGQQGGSLVFAGPADQIHSQKNSLTANYLSYRTRIPIPKNRRKISQENALSIFGATSHNLKNVDITFPLNTLVCLTGVSGSGKSTLAFDILYKNILKARHESVSEVGEIKKLIGHDLINEVILVDQSPLSKTPRSNPALYVGIYDAIRELFAATESAQSQGFNASAFSFNTGTGRCDRCQGMGYEKIEMQFLSDIYLPCSECHGKRFQPHVLRVLYHEKSIADLLATTLDEAIEFFKARQNDELTPRGKTNAQTITDGLQLLCDVGLGYLTLGQPLNQLSGGEAQRIKLVSYLSSATSRTKKKIKGNLLILDEPTTGLHFDDVRILLDVLQRLVDSGHSLLVIEHNLEVIKSADWIIDMGPEGGDQGGQIIVEGTPEQVAETKTSHTGKFLKSILSSKTLKETKISKPVKIKTLPNAIQIRGARHHNLKNISLTLPLDTMTVITGLSGSGKSTLAFDIIFAEGQRRYLDSLNTYARQFVQQFEKPDVDLITGIPPTVAIEQNVTRGGGKSTVGTVTEIHHFIRLLFSKLGVQHDPKTGEKAVRQTIAGIQKQIDALLQKHKTLDVVAPLIKARKGFHTEIARWAEKKEYRLLRVDGKWIEPEKFKALDRYREHTIDVLIGTLLRKQKSGETAQFIHDALKHGRGSLYVIPPTGEEILLSTHLFCPKSGRSFEELDPRQFSYNSPHGWCPTCEGFGTVLESSLDTENALEREAELEAKYEASESSPVCPECHGTRLNAISRAVRFAEKTIGEISNLSVLSTKHFFETLSLQGRDKEIACNIIPEILQRLHFLEQVGLNYLQLVRSAKTLSGGESQRIRLAAQLGSNLEGVLYVLDEPTIGLHPRDNADLLKILKQLQAKGNSLLIVEHDEETMRQADHLIDLGPGAGTRGGEIIAQGSWQDIAKNTRSVTGTLLGEPLLHPLNGKRRDYENSFWLTITKARANNLKSVDLKIPLNRLTVFCGVSGSGKSTLMREILLPAVQGIVARPSRSRKAPAKSSRHNPWDKIKGAELITKVIEVDQSPIGKTSRSTPATYVGIFDLIREVFAQMPESRVRGYTGSRFSYNSKGGRCEACQGQGACKLEMSFLPTLYVPCEVCEGKRYNRDTLEIKFKDKSIADCLAMTVEEAVIFFKAHPKIYRPLNLLEETGLGYLTLGQSSPTLSGGEAQRLKLVTELARDNAGHCLYLLEEPTIGLHLADVRRLLEVAHRLVEGGHTVVIIEHNLDVIAEADYVVEVGPEGGDRGGEIIAQGSPELLHKHKRSITAPFLKTYLHSKN